MAYQYVKSIDRVDRDADDILRVFIDLGFLVKLNETDLDIISDD